MSQIPRKPFQFQNSTQSLYDTRQHGGYMEYQGNHRSNHRNNGRYSNQQHQQHRQPFERPGGNHYVGYQVFLMEVSGGGEGLN